MFISINTLVKNMKNNNIDKLMLNENGFISKSKENEEILKHIEKSEPLTSLQMLKIAIHFRKLKIQLPIADRLINHAMHRIVNNKEICNFLQISIDNTKKTETNVSLLDKIWTTVIKAFGGSKNGSEPEVYCEFVCLMPLLPILLEKCPGKDWRPIGLCIGFETYPY